MVVWLHRIGGVIRALAASEVPPVPGGSARGLGGFRRVVGSLGAADNATLHRRVESHRPLPANDSTGPWSHRAQPRAQSPRESPVVQAQSRRGRRGSEGAAGTARHSVEARRSRVDRGVYTHRPARVRPRRRERAAPRRAMADSRERVAGDHFRQSGAGAAQRVYPREHDRRAFANEPETCAPNAHTHRRCRHEAPPRGRRRRPARTGHQNARRARGEDQHRAALRAGVPSGRAARGRSPRALAYLWHRPRRPMAHRSAARP